MQNEREGCIMNIDTNLHVIKELTPKQQSIVDNMTYPNFVKAGAGTGKTEVVVQKILKLLETNNAPLSFILHILSNLQYLQ